MYKCKICRFAQLSFRIFVRFVEGDKMDKTLERIVNELKLQKKRKIDLTDHLGMVNSAFGHWVSGRNKSYLKYLYAIAAYLDVSVEYLKGETDIKKAPLSVESGDRLFCLLSHQGNFLCITRKFIGSLQNHRLVL